METLPDRERYESLRLEGLKISSGLESPVVSRPGVSTESDFVVEDSSPKDEDVTSLNPIKTASRALSAM